MGNFTLLHTSDWHLGHQIYQNNRDAEFTKFLDWLNDSIRARHVDCVVIAGDVFDTGLPSISAQKMYYDFLLNAAQAGTTNIIITAGNHDSPAFLTAAAQILRGLKVHVIGAISENPEDEIITLHGADGSPQAIICAVPYLREKDARLSRAGESIEDKEANLAAGIRAHYQEIAALAERERAGRDIPVIGTGHLFARGAASGDSERSLYIGTLGALPHDIFSDTFDYVALGHIHKPQKIGNSETRRYSGSPLPMSFAEAGQKKGTALVRFQGRQAEVEILPAPEFRSFQRIRGSSEYILDKLRELLHSRREVWLELEHDGTDAFASLKTAAEELTKDTPLEILRIKPSQPVTAPGVVNASRNLEDMTPKAIFMERVAGLAESERDRMATAFDELLALWHAAQRDEVK